MASYPTTLKISCDGETRRVCRASVTSFDELKALLVSFWGEHNFVLQYKDDDGDLITVSSDSEFQESLSVASAAPVLRFAAFRSLKDLRTELHAAMAPAKSLPVHQNIVCDKSGMNPIVGPRYHVPGANYDLCEAEFTKLPEAERLLFVKIDSPGSHPVPCCEKTTEVPNPIALLLNSRRRRASCFRHHRPAEASEAAREYDAAAAGCAGLGQTSVSVDDLILQAAIADSMHALGYTDDDAEVATALASAQKRRWERGSLQDSQPQEGAAMELLTSFLGDEGILAARELAQVAAAAAASLAQTPRGSEGSKGTSGTSSAPEESCGSGLVELLGAVAAAHLGEGKGHGFKHHRKGCFGKGSGKGHGKGKGCGKGKGSFGRRGVGNADGEAVAVHHGISCDKSGMNPIVGTRYHVPGANFDLCEAEFAKLPEAERLLFVKIYHPGATPLACMAEKPVSASADGGGSSSLAAGGASDEFLFGGGSGDDEVTDAPPAPKAAAAAVEAQAAAEAKAAAEARAAAEAKAAAEAAAQAKAAEAKAVETSAATGEIKFQTQLAELAELGFYDRDANVVLLERYQGRMDRTLNALLDSSLN